MVVPAVGIDGTFTHTLAEFCAGFQDSTQKGMAVAPSLAVNRTSLPSALALAKGNPLESKTLIWKLLKATPELLPTEIALRYCQAELYQVIAPCALAGTEHTTNPLSNTAARKIPPRLPNFSTPNRLSNLRPRPPRVTASVVPFVNRCTQLSYSI